MSKTVYIAHKGQILAALSDDEYSDGKLRCSRDVVGVARHITTPRGACASLFL